MNRREFIQAGTFGLAASAVQGHAADYDRDKVRRVGLIGCGWYGKGDLLRLIQVSPVEVVSLCDVDQAHAGETPPIWWRRGRHRRRGRARFPIIARC